MKPRKAREVANGLVRKGFVASNSHHKFYSLHVDGKKTSIKTKISHGEDECNQYILRQIAKQIHLDERAFCDLLDCPLSHAAYVKILVRKKAILV